MSIQHFVGPIYQSNNSLSQHIDPTICRTVIFSIQEFSGPIFCRTNNLSGWHIDPTIYRADLSIQQLVRSTYWTNKLLGRRIDPIICLAAYRSNNLMGRHVDPTISRAKQTIQLFFRVTYRSNNFSGQHIDPSISRSEILSVQQFVGPKYFWYEKFSARHFLEPTLCRADISIQKLWGRHIDSKICRADLSIQQVCRTEHTDSTIYRADISIQHIFWPIFWWTNSLSIRHFDLTNCPDDISIHLFVGSTYHSINSSGQHIDPSICRADISIQQFDGVKFCRSNNMCLTDLFTVQKFVEPAYFRFNNCPGWYFVGTTIRRANISIEQLVGAKYCRSNILLCWHIFDIKICRPDIFLDQQFVGPTYRFNNLSGRLIAGPTFCWAGLFSIQQFDGLILC